MSSKPPITSILGLLEALYVEGFANNRKSDAILVSYQAGEAEVREHFDTGRGNSNALSSETTPVDWNIFVQARDASYTAGIPEPGYVSRIKSRITAEGKSELFRLLREAVTGTKAVAQSESQPG